MVLQSIIAAIIPAVIYVSIIYWVDRYEKEPLWLLAATFFWGAIPAVIAALILNLIFGLPFYFLLGEGLGDAAVASIVAPLVEESTKGAALLLIFFFWRDQIDSLLDGIIYGAMVGMGFAMVENVLYFVSVFEEGGLQAWQTNIFMRAVVFGFNHSLYSGMTGLGIAYARLKKKGSVTFFAPVAGWSAAVLLHFIHNAGASAGGVLGDLVCIPLLVNAWGGVLLTIVIIVWSLWQERKWIKKYLAEEVAADTLTVRQYETAASSLNRIRHNWKQLAQNGIRGYIQSVRFFQKCSKLAYVKHHQDWYHDARSLQKMQELRREVQQLGREVM